MDGPTVPWTVADLFKSPSRLALTYHVMSTPYDVLSPVGGMVGGAAFLTTGVGTTLARSVAMGGLTGGAVGMTLGLAGMMSKARQGEALEPLPWNDDGIQTRVQGIQNNYKIRTLDLSVWTGVLVAGGIVAAYGTGSLGKGTWGIVQALSLGSVTGSLCGMGIIGVTEYKRNKQLEKDTL